MLGRKKRKKKREAKRLAEEQAKLAQEQAKLAVPKVEQMVKEYKTIKQFQKAQKSLSRKGWYVKAQTNKVDSGFALFGFKNDIIVVTWERIK